ncbi:Putative glycosyltransferase EpsF [Peribacillus frigoritolerans]|uniref:glycosyltransferase n=1 Tax=Peribacillus frigoritolerans TaxID=450367 RepID=UPI0030CCD8D3
MIKVLHYGLSSNMGGIETYLLKLYSNIDRNKYKFDFLDDTFDGACFEKEFKQMGSEFFKITPRRISPSRNMRDLDQIFQHNHFDIFHCHLNTLSYINPIKIALKYNCKVIVHSRNGGSSYKLHTKLLHYYHLLFLPKTQIKMLAVSKKAADWLFGKKAEVTIVNNGIDVNRFLFKQNTRDEYRQKMGVLDSFVLIHVGAYLFAKNHKFLIKVFHEVHKINPKSVLWLVGSGENKKEIQNLVDDMELSDCVKFLGGRTDVSNLLSAADCFVFPSYYEGFPNAVLEAETSGLPCIISNKITNEVVIRNDCDQLSLDLTCIDWAKKILNVKQNTDRETAYELIETKGFSVKDEIKKIENIYRGVMNNR